MVYIDKHSKNSEFGANSVGPDQTAPKEQSDQGQHCLSSNVHLLGALLYEKPNSSILGQ